METPQDETLHQAAELLAGGKYDEGRSLLARYLRQNPNSEEAWYLLSLAVSEREKHVYCLQQVLRVNPNNEKARQRLEKLTGARPAAPAPPQPTPGPARGEQPVTPTPPAGWARPATTTFEPQGFRAVRPATPTFEPQRFRAEMSQPERTEAAPADRQQKTIKRGIPAGLVAALAAGGLLLLAAIAFLGWQLYQVSIPLPTPLAAVLSTPRRTLPPTWTPTATFTPSPTRTIPPTPTITLSPTLAAPGPTAQARMAELEKQVMGLRGLAMKFDVPRFVTTRPRYQEILNSEFFTAERLAELQREEWTLKALGMISPTFNLTELAMNNSMAGVAGIYVPWDKEIYVFGLRFTGVEAFVYVHEFDHALVDQNYPFDTLLGLYPDCQWDSQRCEAITALVEGDATLLMYLWWQNYASSEEYRDFWYYVPPAVLPSGQKMPPFASVDYLLNYQFGMEFANYLYVRGGWAAVNRAYSRPPTSSEQILHPEKYSAGEAPVTVTDPPLEQVFGAGWEMIASDSLGEWDTYLLLGFGVETAAQLDAETAANAAAGWGGDHYVIYRKAATGELALAVHWIWDTQSAANQFSEAFLAYQNRRLVGEPPDLGRGQCRQEDGMVSCLLVSGRETLWLLAPGQELVEAMMAEYAGFR